METPRGPWSRRWFRRLTYLLAAGGLLAGATAWLAQRPEVDRWLVAQLDRVVRRETGLGLDAGRLELHPFQGRVLVHDLSVGGDLFHARLLELDVDWASLLRTPHLRRVLLEEPVLLLDRERLARIKLRERPKTTTSTDVRLDRLDVRAGRVTVREPAWGLPRGDFRFEVSGRGWAVNQLEVSLQVPEMVLGPDPQPFRGKASLAATVNERRLDVQRGQVQVGDNRLAFRGGYGFREGQLNLVADGSLDLVQAQRLARPGQAPAASGTVAFQGQADGPLDALVWSGKVSGQQLRAKGLPLQPGALAVAAHGNPGEIQVESLAWNSRDGRAQASGTWSAQDGTRVQAAIQAVPLGQVATRTRAAILRDLSASLEGELRMPPGPDRTPWSFPGIEKVSFRGTGAFHQNGQKVGGLELELADRRFKVPGRGSGPAGAGGPRLGRGHPGPDRAGRGDRPGERGHRHRRRGPGASGLGHRHGAQAGATGPPGHGRAGPGGGPDELEPATGFQLDGRVEVAEPRWHGARADRLAGTVTIDRDVLRVSDIQLDKGDGRATGDLWLTWADLPKGSKQIDMTYRAERLPVREGLKAADVGDLELDGTGSGWVRLYGPFDRMVLEGHAQAEQAQVYGLQVPAAAADFFMDIEGDRLRATGVRVADDPGHLGQGDEAPTGPLALQGSLDMDIKHETWTLSLAGAVDTVILGLPGPRFQGQADARLEGPIVAPVRPPAGPTGPPDPDRRPPDPGRPDPGGPGGHPGVRARQALPARRPGRQAQRPGAPGGGPARQGRARRHPGGGPGAPDRRHRQAGLAPLRQPAQGCPPALPRRGGLEPPGPPVARHPGPVRRPVRRVLPGPVRPGPSPGTCPGSVWPWTWKAALRWPRRRRRPRPRRAATPVPVPDPAQAVPPRGSRRRPAVSATSMNLKGRLPFSATAPWRWSWSAPATWPT